MITGVVGIVAFVVVLAGLLAAAGYGGYLAMLMSAAKKRAGGQPAVDFARKQLPIAGGAAGAGLIALLLSMGGIGADIVAILLAVGSGGFSIKALQSTQRKLHRGDF